MKASTLSLAAGLLACAVLSGCGEPSPTTWPAGSAPAPTAPAPIDAVAAQPRRPELGEQPTLNDYLRVAALNNPGLAAAFHRWKAAVEQVPQVAALPDPRLTYRHFIREVETRVGAQRNALALTQTFPWFGNLSLRSDAAAEGAKARFQQYQAAKLRLFYRVKLAYYEYGFLRQAVKTVDDNLRLMKNIDAVARTRYKATAASHPDVIRLQVEMGKLDDRLRELRDLRGPIVARLNAALNRPAAAELPWPGEIEEKGVSVTDADLFAWLGESNPELKALAHEIARNRRGIDLAKKDYFPDVTIGLDWIDTAASTGGRHPSDDGKDPLVAMVSVNVPIWREKLSAGVRQARHRHQAARHQRTQQANTLAAELRLALYGFRDAERKIDLYRDTLIPKAAESLKVTQTAFGAGKATFTDLIDAQRVYLEFELGYRRGLASRAQRLAELEMLVGREIPPAGNPQPEPDVQIRDGKGPSDKEIDGDEKPKP
jgi:cobalt-zinc-cadmium efflux system outer membrane protein